jgi:hypothetical protein
MNTKLTVKAAIFLAFGMALSAHRLDEYLEGTFISVEKDHVNASMRLIPGVAVFPAVMASIDTNGDGVISETERRAYAERVLRDISLSVDGLRLKPRLISVAFPPIDEMKEGLGAIQIEFSAALPRGGTNRTLIFENHHQSRIAAYLVNCLVPRDRSIRITAQNRNQNQSFYRLDYVQGGVTDVHAPLARSVGFASIFRLGVRHIAEGTDHLLFLLALLLPAPLMASGARWAGFGGVRHSLTQILKVVSAFTLGHSITLALATFELIRVADRPIEVLIAVSILVSAAHALRPFFPGREAVIAAFFGLIHGLAFATTLGQLGLGGWVRVAGIFGFNLGIETMQLIVVAAIMPSLVLMSQTRTYSFLRIAGALFAAFAAAGWISERLLGVHNSVDVIVDNVAHHAVGIAGAFYLTSVVSWLLHNAHDKKSTATEPVNGRLSIEFD